MKEVITISLILLLIGLLMFLASCEEYEPLPPQPVEIGKVANADTSTFKAIVAHGYGNEYRVFWHDFNTGWRDTLYVGVNWFKDSVYIPKMEWGQLRIESTDSVYIRLGCIRVYSTIAAAITIKQQ